jgi:hypothetical protein
VIILIRHNEEERVLLRDPRRGKPREERAECLVVGFELADILLLARPEGMSRGSLACVGIDLQWIAIVRVGDL